MGGHAWSVTSEDAKCERDRVSKIQGYLGTHRPQSRELQLFLLNFLCNVNRAPYRWSLDFHPTSPACAPPFGLVQLCSYTVDAAVEKKRTTQPTTPSPTDYSTLFTVHNHTGAPPGVGFFTFQFCEHSTPVYLYEHRTTKPHRHPTGHRQASPHCSHTAL